MAQYIDKDALVAEIERLACPEHGSLCDKLLEFLDTLEVKEVDLEEEIKFNYNSVDGLEFEEYKRIAKYYFELGLKAQKGEKV